MMYYGLNNTIMVSIGCLSEICTFLTGTNTDQAPDTAPEQLQLFTYDPWKIRSDELEENSTTSC